jgi:hypothetical protein
MSKKQKIVVVLLGALITFMVGCSALQNVITPAYIDPNAIEYSEVDVPEFLPWTTIWDLDRVERGIEYKHYLEIVRLQREIEDNDFLKNWFKDSLNTSRQDAVELRDNLFSAGGPASILLTALPGLGIGWLALSKPSDKKHITELEKKNGSV